MNLHRLLQEREAASRPVRVVLIGAGKFGSMYLSQARRTPGIHLLAVADLAPAAREGLPRCGSAGSAARLEAKSFDEAVKHGQHLHHRRRRRPPSRTRPPRS